MEQPKPYSPLDLLSLGVAAFDTREFLAHFAQITPSAIGARTVFVWLANKTNGRYELVTPASNNGQTTDSSSVHWLEQDLVRQLPSDRPTKANYSVPWETDGFLRLVAQLRVSGLTAGALEIDFDQSPGSDCSQFTQIAAELVSHACDAVDHVLKSQTVQELNSGLCLIAAADTVDDLKDSLLESMLRITGTAIGSVLLLDKETGGLDIARRQPLLRTEMQLSMEEGITGLCLRQLEPKRVGDVSKHSKYKKYWPRMCSELAVPLYIPKTSARVPNANFVPGTHLEEHSKPIGVLNVESPLLDAFSQFEQDCLVRLAATASMIYDHLQFRDSLRDLHAAESELAKHLAGGDDWLDVIKAVGDHIHRTLAYSHINISLVSLDGKRIKSEYVWWNRSKEDELKFRELSDHDIATSPDIQADVVRRKQIEIPTSNDPRFHPKIHHTFNLDPLIRVYMPLMMGDVVVGTLEAGYRRRYRHYIFEQDIQILKTLSDYAAAAIWKKRRGQLDILRHEIAAPRQDVMENAMFLQRHWRELSSEKIGWKLEDIFSDGEVIDFLLDKIEYYVTGHLRPSKSEYCNVASTVIRKTVFQQSRLLRSINLELDKTIFVPSDLKLWTRVNKVNAIAVFNNLFANAIKYRRSDDSLRIELAMETLPDRYLVRISDNGIGIEAGYKDRIFEEGFRAPLAVEKAQGSGLGLWLSRQYMREMGGDVTLQSAKDPTVFQVMILKKEA